MKQSVLFVWILIIVSGSFLANAQEDASEVFMKIDPPRQGSFYDQQFEPFVGFGLGYMDENESLKTEGLPFNLKFVGSFFPVQSWVADAGVGFVTQTFQNQSEKDMVFSGLMDLAARYRFSGDWQVGPQLKTYIGNGDSFGSSSDNFTTFIGAQVMREQLLFGKYRNRMGLSLVTDIGIPNQDAFVTSFEVQFALGSMVENRVSYNQDVNEVEEKAEVVVKKAYKLPVTQKSVFFDLNQRRLAENVKADLNRSVSKETMDLDNVKYIEVIGYADSTGPEGLNLKVSMERARSVKTELIKLGVPENKIRTRWVGESEARANQVEQPELRKVEVKIVE
ncbi:MAG: OmpA family protein [Bdellovibrionales bacterium]|nr:OmpA family protein [Bdellovibrionales bacterium]